jgi:hypothetical protein
MVAAAVLLLLHVPSEVASLKVVTESKHTLAEPAIEAGKGFTVKPTLLPVDNGLTQPFALVTDVTVIVVKPEWVISVEGMINVPVPEAITSVAVWDVTVLAPLRL